MNRTDLLLLAALVFGTLGFTACDSFSGTDGDDDSADISGTPTASIFLPTCSEVGTKSMGSTGQTLTCAVTTGSVDWDFYVIDGLTAGDCVHIFADNVDGKNVGDADLYAYAVDDDGLYYGLAADYSQLDDETACSATPWDGFDCPEASVQMVTDGSLTVGVAQVSTVDGRKGTCSDDVPYTMYIAVNGTDLDLSGGPAIDDTPLAE